MKVLNLTQHTATPEQIEDGVVDLQGETREKVLSLLNFEQFPKRHDMLVRAEALARIAESAPRNTDRDGPGFSAVMIGGAPFFTPTLVSVLDRHGIMALCAFSKRESVEEQTPDGVRKVSVFRHLGFVDARPAQFRDGTDFDELSRMADDMLSSVVPTGVQTVFSAGQE